MPVPWHGAHWWQSLVWAGFSIKTQTKLKILSLKRQPCVFNRNGVATSPQISGKVGHVLLSCASGWCILFDFLFLLLYCIFINLLDTAQGAINLTHQLIENSVISTSSQRYCQPNVSIHQINCCMIYSFLSFNF